jgi:membrane-bound ClpP family serine protease
MTPIIIICVLLALGIIFLIIEIFFLPGITIAGIVGALFIAAAVIFAYTNVGNTAGTLTLVGGLTFLALAVWRFMKSKTLDRMALKVDITEKVEPLKGIDIKVGDEGKTVSRLAPMGKIRIHDAIVEAKTVDGFIDQNETVVVLEVYNNNVLVEKKEEENQ